LPVANRSPVNTAHGRERDHSARPVGLPAEEVERPRRLVDRDGVVKRGKTLSYVVRVADPLTGKSKPPARLHDLRHVHATLLLTAGVPVHVVAERLGHADPAITLRVYAHVIRQHADEVANTFAAAVDGDSPRASDSGDENANE
jgi:integrase